MINNRYRPFFDDDIDLSHPEDVTAVRLCLEPHAYPLTATYNDLLMQHGMIHMLGLEDGEAHSLCLAAISQTNEDLARMKQSLHN